MLREGGAPGRGHTGGNDGKGIPLSCSLESRGELRLGRLPRANRLGVLGSMEEDSGNPQESLENNNHQGRLK